MENCCSCFSPKANLVCGACNQKVCKKCAHFQEEGKFSFLPTVPAELKHLVYCTQCFDSIVAAPLEEYEQTMEKAKQINVFFKEQGKESRLLSRRADPIEVKECDDREETLMRLAFLAAQQDFDAIIDVDLSSKKVRVGGYQTLVWSGSAVPSFSKNSRTNR